MILMGEVVWHGTLAQKWNFGKCGAKSHLIGPTVMPSPVSLIFAMRGHSRYWYYWFYAYGEFRWHWQQSLGIDKSNPLYMQ